MKLNEVVPWGRNLAEYQAMFALSEADLNAKILGCGDGPASFNTEMKQKGYSVISIDPIYQFSAEQIRQRVCETYTPIISQVEQNAERYVWNHFGNAEALGTARLASMEAFLLDYELGQQEGRYLFQSLPILNFSDRTFQLCLCSHLLFLYSERLSLEFHLASILELLRVAEEVRIFPLLKLDCEPSPYLESILLKLQECGYCWEIKTVIYEFQRGGNEMLKIVRSHSH